jgi:hypothetical protein
VRAEAACSKAVRSSMCTSLCNRAAESYPFSKTGGFHVFRSQSLPARSAGAIRPAVLISMINSGAGRYWGAALRDSGWVYASCGSGADLVGYSAMSALPQTGEVLLCPLCAISRQMHCNKNHYSITSSARASRVSGTLRPSAFAVLRLIANSYLVGCCTGRSAGLAPLRI